MYIIYNTIEDGARGVEPYFSFHDTLEEANENFVEADSFLQYGEALHLCELKDQTPESLSEELINEIHEEDFSNVGEYRVIREAEYYFSEEAGETYSR